MTATLSMWVVYDDALDYPGQAVARRFEVRPRRPHPTNELLFGATVEAVRAQLPAGLVRIPRADVDEPQIVEVWL